MGVISSSAIALIRMSLSKIGLGHIAVSEKALGRMAWGGTVKAQ